MSLTHMQKQKLSGSYKMSVKNNIDYDPKAGFWDEELNMWVKYDDMELAL